MYKEFFGVVEKVYPVICNVNFGLSNFIQFMFIQIYPIQVYQNIPMEKGKLKRLKDTSTTKIFLATK